MVPTLHLLARPPAPAVGSEGGNELARRVSPRSLHLGAAGTLQKIRKKSRAHTPRAAAWPSVSTSRLAASQSPRQLGVGMSAGEAVHYPFRFVLHRRRILLNTAYAQHVLLDGASAADMSDRLMAALYAAGAAACAWSIASAARYTVIGQVLLSLGCATATGAASWPAAPPEQGSGSPRALVALQCGLTPQVARRARRWLQRARARLIGRDAGEARSMSSGGADYLLSSRSGDTVGSLGSTATKSAAGGVSAHGAVPYASELSRCDLESASSDATRIRAACGSSVHGAAERDAGAHAVERWRRRTMMAARECLAAHLASPQMAYGVACLLQLTMAWTALHDFVNCVARPPSLPAAALLMVLASLIPLIDTLALTCTWLCDRSETALPSLHASLRAGGRTLDSVDRAIRRTSARLLTPLAALSEALAASIEMLLVRRISRMHHAQVASARDAEAPHTRAGAARDADRPIDCKRDWPQGDCKRDWPQGPSGILTTIVQAQPAAARGHAFGPHPFVMSAGHCLSRAWPSLQAYGAMVRGSPFKSAVAIAAAVIWIERYSQLLLAQPDSGAAAVSAPTAAIGALGHRLLSGVGVGLYLVGGLRSDRDDGAGSALRSLRRLQRRGGGGTGGGGMGGAQPRERGADPSTESVLSMASTDALMFGFTAAIELLSQLVDAMLDGVGAFATAASTRPDVIRQIKPRE